jgi:hypothetical protein
MVRRVISLGLLVLLTGCSSDNPYLTQTLKPAAQRHESKEWFEKEWGKPSGSSKRFWGGETWTYYRIAGGTHRLLGGINPHDCEIKLYFDKEGKLDDYDYSSDC